MKFYSKIFKVCLPAPLALKAREFADRVVVTTDYSDSNQVSKQKITEDHFVSKLGEESARIVLSKYATVTGPDYTIYPAYEKSWSEDLFVDSVGVAVKTQKRSVAARFELSWTFQCGVARRDVILDRPFAWVVFVVYDDLNPYNCYVFPPYQVNELTFGEPKIWKLKGHKKVVYAKDLPLNR